MRDAEQLYTGTIVEMGGIVETELLELEGRLLLTTVPASATSLITRQCKVTHMEVLPRPHMSIVLMLNPFNHIFSSASYQ